MPRTRTPRPASERPNKQAVARRSGATRAVRPSFKPTSPLLSSEEKHELIRAHAAMHAPHDPVQAVSLWAGAAAAFAVVVVAWWWMSRPAYDAMLHRPLEPGLQAMVQDTKAFSKRMGERTDEAVGGLTSELAAAAARLDALSRQADERQRAIDRAALILSSASASSSRASLFQPTATATRNIER